MTDNSEIDMEAVAMVDAALADGKRKVALVQDLCDALVGNLDDQSSLVLWDITRDLCRDLVDKYSVDELRKYLQERLPPLRGNYTTLPAEDELAIRLLQIIASGMRVGGEVLLGVLGVTGKKVTDGGKKGVRIKKENSLGTNLATRIRNAAAAYTGEPRGRNKSISLDLETSAQYVARVLKEAKGNSPP